MQPETNILPESNTSALDIRVGTKVRWRSLVLALSGALVLFLALYNLTDYPTPWFDEGSHLHVPKTLVRFGVYADYSSEGFRYYGPTVGVGPTVMLPIAAAFRLLGIGLWQARLVMVLYLLATVYSFYHLAKYLGGWWLAWIATALLVTSQGVALLEYGRQVLGEVPGLFFVSAGLLVWFGDWERSSWKRLGLAGLLFGLATVTKHQYLLLLAPTLGLAWLANLIYYRKAPQRVFIVPGLITAMCFALWQVYLIIYLGPATTSENLAMFRQFTAGAATVFAPHLMERGIRELVSLKVYLGWLLPVLLYGFMLALPRQREGQQWGVLLILVTVNLAWYVVASISWLRYAFPGLAVASLFVARFFYDLTDGFRFDWAALKKFLLSRSPGVPRVALNVILLAWLGLMIALPLVQVSRKVIMPAFNDPVAMADYMDQNVPRDVLVETWEPEMGFLTDHTYHFPPPLLLNDAVAYKWLDGPAPADQYNFVQEEHPDYILVGEFARYVSLYPTDYLADQYTLVSSIGRYELYRINQ